MARIHLVSGEIGLAVAGLMQFDTYSRSSEIMRTETDDIISPIEGTSFQTYAVCLNPCLTGASSEAGMYDETVAFTDGH